MSFCNATSVFDMCDTITIAHLFGSNVVYAADIALRVCVFTLCTVNPQTSVAFMLFC